MDTDQDESENYDEKDIQKRLNLSEEADKEFNQRYGFIELAVQVAKEMGVSYFEIVEHPAVHVLALSQYLIDKVKKIEREQKQNGKSK